MDHCKFLYHVQSLYSELNICLNQISVEVFLPCISVLDVINTKADSTSVYPSNMIRSFFSLHRPEYVVFVITYLDHHCNLNSLSYLLLCRCIIETYFSRLIHRI